MGQAVGSVLLADPSRVLGWTGRVLSEVGFESAGSTLRLYGALLEPSTGRMVGGTIGGGLAAFAGRTLLTAVGLGPIGGIVGGVVGGQVFGQVGVFIESLWDQPCSPFAGPNC